VGLWVGCLFGDAEDVSREGGFVWETEEEEEVAAERDDGRRHDGYVCFFPFSLVWVRVCFCTFFVILVVAMACRLKLCSRGL